MCNKIEYCKKKTGDRIAVKQDAWQENDEKRKQKM